MFFILQIYPSLMHPQDSCQDPNHDGA